jgi:MerR family transcriptional regulator, light-induced transcriptional regulator
MGTSVATPQGPSSGTSGTGGTGGTAGGLRPDDTDAGASGGLLTIGELARQAGISTQLVRAWEQRFGFPEPVRLPSGHRRYTAADVRSVQRVVEERDRGMRLEEAIATILRSGQVGESSSVYAALSRRHPGLASYTLTKRTLLALSWAIEDEAVAQSSSGVLLGTFQRGRYYGQSRRRWEDLARTARASVAMADFPAHDDESRPATVALPPDSPLLREWVVVHEAPDFAVALVAFELPGHGAVGDDRLFEALWSVDGRVVRDAAVLTAQAGAAAGSLESARVLALLGEDRSLSGTPPGAAAAVFNRMVAYTDGTTLRARRP